MTQIESPLIQGKFKLVPVIQTLSIQDKSARLVRFSLNANSEFAWAQRQFVSEIERQYRARQPIRIIVLKARQLGISTVTAGAFFTWCFIHENTSALIVAHETDASQSIFEKIQLFWEEWPFKRFYTARHMSQRRLSWRETRSTLRIATARNVQSGRGRTVHLLHGSEVAFWDDPDVLMTGLGQTIPNAPGSVIILESTANGVGNYFHQTWLKASLRESEFTPLFFPWFKHFEYALPNSGLRVRDLDGYEISLINKGATLDNIAWRRWKIMNMPSRDENSFMQEYPAEPHEAFISTGSSVFPLDKLAECYFPEPGFVGFLNFNGNSYDFIRESSGNLKIFRLPNPNTTKGKYYIAGDATFTSTGDYAVIQVVSVFTHEQVAVWRGKCNPVEFADRMAELGYFYNNAPLVPEIEGPGQATIGALLKMGYPKVWRHRWADKHQGKPSEHFGWSTNQNRKDWMLAYTISLLATNSMIIHDDVTYLEFQNYANLPNGDKGAIAGNDDTVTSLCIAIIAIKTDSADIMQDAVAQFADIGGVRLENAFGVA